MGFAEDVMNAVRKATDKAGNAKPLALKCGMSPSTVSRWLRGERTPKLEELGKVLDLMGVKFTPDELAPAGKDVCFVDARTVPAGEGLPSADPVDYLAVPLVGEVGAGPGIIPEDKLLSWFLVYKHTRAIMYRRDLIAVQIGDHSTSMVPTLKPGDIVLVDRSDKDCSKPGRIMLTMDPDGAGRIKRVSVARAKDDHDYIITVYSDNTIENPPENFSLREDYGGDWGKVVGGAVVWAWSDMVGR